MRDFSFVYTGKPANSSAASCLGKGVHFEPDKIPGGYHSDKPLPVNPFYGESKHDLTGLRIGNFTVIGYIKKNSHGYSVWLVRCSCGYYETRTARALKKKVEPGKDSRDAHMCSDCAYLEFIKNRKVK